jgi:hypothetical protein
VNEQTLKRGLMDALRRHLPQAVALRHEDRYLHGCPDLSFSLNGFTSWWEIKYADPMLRSKEIQRHLCQRLATTTRCAYIVYQGGIPVGANRRPRQIRIVPPLQIEWWQRAGVVIESGSFDHYSVVAYFALVHGAKI